jgi:uncharacterized repeat protein (TIGR01451 family)
LTVNAIAAGAGYNLGLASDGTVWTWGQVPAQVSGLTGVATIAAGGACHNLAVKSDGSVWEWVVFGVGQSCNYVSNRSTPTQVSGLSGVVAVADGGAHSLALKSDGTVWAWGDNSWGQLGDGTARSRTAPVQVSGLSAVVVIAAGQAHSLAVRSDGTVFAWGHNWYGQLGGGTIAPVTTGLTPSAPVQVSGLTGVAAVSAGYGHSLALKRDGTVWAWGHNGAGQSGDGTKDNVRPTAAQVSGLTGVAAIAAAGYGSQAVKNDGTVWAWPGLNQLTPAQVNGLSGVVAVAAGLALKADGTVWTWEGAPGGGAMAIQVAPGQIGELTGVAAVAAGFDGGLALNRDGTVWQWGSRSTPIQVSGLNGVVAIAAGSDHNLALKGDGAVWQWSGQLAPSQVSGLTGVVRIAAGETRGLAVKSDGTVWAWSGQSAPVQVSGLSGVVAVSVAFEWWWGELLDARNLALKSDGTVWVWAEGEWVRSLTPVRVSGLDGIVAIAGGDASLALKADGTVWEWQEAATVRPAPFQVNGLSGVVAVAVGASAEFGTVAPHRLALKRDGTIWAWGSNGRGQLGDGTTASRGAPVQVAALSGVAGIGAAGYHSLAVTGEGTVWEWGLLGDGTTRSTPVQVIQPGSPDLAIAMSHDGAFTAGEQGVYVLTITNTGLTATTGPITVTDTLPSGLSYFAATGAGWTCSVVEQVVTCTNPGPINPGSSSTITLTVRVEPQAWPGVTNLATVTNASDRNLANNTIGDPTVVSLGQK